MLLLLQDNTGPSYVLDTIVLTKSAIYARRDDRTPVKAASTCLLIAHSHDRPRVPSTSTPPWLYDVHNTQK